MSDAHRKRGRATIVLLGMAILLIATVAAVRARVWEDRTDLGLLLAAVALAAWTGVLFVRRIRQSERALADAARELSQAGEEAQRNAAFVEGVGAATPDIIYAKDLDLRFVYVNPAAARVIGLPVEQILGRRPIELVNH